METLILERLKSITTYEIVILVASFVICYFFIVLFKRRKNPLPPGPWGWPIVGYKYHFGNEPHKHFIELGKRYESSVIGVNIGSQYLVMFNDYETMIEAYRKEESLGKVDESLYNYSEYTHFSTINGPVWKEYRKFFTGFFKNLFRTVDDGFINLHTIISDEIDHLLEVLKNIKKEDSVNIRELFREGTNNTLLKYIFNKTLPPDHPFILAMAEQQELLLETALITDWTVCLPKLRWFTRRVLPKQKKLKKMCKIVEKFVDDEIEDHKKTLDADNPRDFIDHALLKERECGTSSTFSDGTLNSNIQIILAGGSDTTRTSLEWEFMLMAKFPEVQENIFKEIKEVFGVDQKPKWEQRYLLPYTMATVMECQRWKTIVPIITTKMALQDFTVKGYKIPKGSSIAANIWAIHHDENHWDKPAEFNPQHYLTKDGKLNINEKFFAYSYGKRDCPGKNQAMMELFLFLVAVIQKHKILPPVEGVSLEENNSLVTGPKKPFLRFEPRHC